MISTHVFHPVGTERSASVSAGSWRIRWITRRLGHLKTYVHLSQPGTGNHVFFIFLFFSFWSSFFWLENYHCLFIPVKFFHYLFIPVFPPFGIFIFLSFASKMVLGPWELPPEAFSRTIFVCFFDCFCALAIFLSYAFKIDLGNCQKEFFLEPFSFFSRVGNFPFCAFKTDLGNLFLEPFSFFFVLVLFSFLCL